MGRASSTARRLSEPGPAVAPAAPVSEPLEVPRPSDAELVGRACQGAPGAEAQLFSRLAPLVNRLVFSTLGPDAEHDDVVHDVFIRIFRSIAGLRDPDRLEAWAARVTLNTVRNEIRRRTLRRWVFWNAFEDPGPLKYVPDLEGRELLTHTHRVLAMLPPDERIVLSLRLFETETIEEIAALTACSHSTAKRRLRRAHLRFVRLAQRDPLLAAWVGGSQAQGENTDG